MVSNLLNNQNFIPALSLILSLCIGVSVIYTRFSSSDAVIDVRTGYTENQLCQQQKELNMLRVGLSQSKVTSDNLYKMFEALTTVVKELKVSNENSNIIMARVDERLGIINSRQDKSDKLLQLLIDKMHMGEE